MKALKISENVYWVGAIDWNVRNFHGYETEKGTTYNAYLILDEKITLVDTVKDCLQEEMLERIRSVIEPDKIDVIISNHACLLYTSASCACFLVPTNSTLLPAFTESATNEYACSMRPTVSCRSMM